MHCLQAQSGRLGGRIRRSDAIIENAQAHGVGIDIESHLHRCCRRMLHGVSQCLLRNAIEMFASLARRSDRGMQVECKRNAWSGRTTEAICQIAESLGQSASGAAEGR